MGCGSPGGPVDDGVDVLGQHPHQVAGDAAAGDVGQRPHVGLGDEVEAVLGVDPGRRQQFLARGCAGCRGPRPRCPAASGRCRAGCGAPASTRWSAGPIERIAITDVADLDPVRAEHGVGLDHADAGRRQVVLVRPQHARVLGGLAAEQRAAGGAAAVGDAGGDGGHLVRHHLAAGDVVEQEQRLGAARHQVVHDHRDEVDPDGVVHVHLLGDDQLGADPVGRRGEQRLLVLVHVQPEQSGEAADVTDDLRAARSGAPWS